MAARLISKFCQVQQSSLQPIFDLPFLIISMLDKSRGPGNPYVFSCRSLRQEPGESNMKELPPGPLPADMYLHNLAHTRTVLLSHCRRRGELVRNASVKANMLRCKSMGQICAQQSIPHCGISFGAAHPSFPLLAHELPGGREVGERPNGGCRGDAAAAVWAWLFSRKFRVLVTAQLQ